MAVYRVGDRVRVVHVEQPTEARVGMEGVVIATGAHNWHHIWNGYEVRVDGGEVWLFNADELEPLTKPKQQEVVSWEEMPCDRNGRYRQPQEVHA